MKGTVKKQVTSSKPSVIFRPRCKLVIKQESTENCTQGCGPKGQMK